MLHFIINKKVFSSGAVEAIQKIIHWQSNTSTLTTMGTEEAAAHKDEAELCTTPRDIEVQAVEESFNGQILRLWCVI